MAVVPLSMMAVVACSATDRPDTLAPSSATVQYLHGSQRISIYCAALASSYCAAHSTAQTSLMVVVLQAQALPISKPSACKLGLQQGCACENILAE